MQRSNIFFAVTAALTVAHDIRTQIQTLKTARLFSQAVEAYEEELKRSKDRIQYLCAMLNEHGIEATEFDLIALNFDIQ